MALYTYEPERLSEQGKDRMRFELGDTDMSGGSDTAALSDEEICYAIDLYKNNWKRSKLTLVESVYMRFSHEVDTSVGGLSLGLQKRVEHWKSLYSELKLNITRANVPSANPAAISAGYFYTGIHDNAEADRPEGGASECI